MIFSIDLVENKTFILKCFIQFPCTNLDGCQKEGGGEANFFNLLQKDGVPRKGGWVQLWGNYGVLLKCNSLRGYLNY